ncbi:hypothetical protein KIN20_002283 [Parelaphostrongylus tenuis]|uniref:Partial AB-hydrolase lipase domain-containing protein n=1 Tax=Parelaphostrongylus tenuis TaxID=148309 RepID=A0AAD5QDF8_PARTN|nr:hypothetical protein KIN20_002283 [Parelaphostrongylus tenuis]
METDVLGYICIISLLANVRAEERRVIPMERPPDLLTQPSLKTFFAPQSPNILFPNGWYTPPPNTFIFPLPSSDPHANVADKSAPRQFLPFVDTGVDESMLQFPTLPQPMPIPLLPPPMMRLHTSTPSPSLKTLNLEPEAIMNVPEIIRHWGYPAEVHQTVTADGYLLTLHRIPYGKGATLKRLKYV